MSDPPSVIWEAPWRRCLTGARSRPLGCVHRWFWLPEPCPQPLRQEPPRFQMTPGAAWGPRIETLAENSRRDGRDHGPTAPTPREAGQGAALVVLEALAPGCLGQPVDAAGPGRQLSPPRPDLRGSGGRFQGGGPLCPVLPLEGPAGVGGPWSPESPWAGEGQPPPRPLLPSAGTCGGAAVQKGLPTPALPSSPRHPRPPRNIPPGNESVRTLALPDPICVRSSGVLSFQCPTALPGGCWETPLCSWLWSHTLTRRRCPTQTPPHVPPPPHVADTSPGRRGLGCRSAACP